jgi:hypothetical protein
MLHIAQGLNMCVQQGFCVGVSVGVYVLVYVYVCICVCVYQLGWCMYL